MRAAVLEQQGQPLVLHDDVEIEEPGPGRMRVRVAHCGVCHSDLSLVDGSFPAPLPIVLGHEAAGVVESVGPGVAGVAPGDPVVLTPCPPCGSCYWCVRGDHSLCVNAVGIQTNTLPDGTTGLSRGGQTLYRGVNVGAFAEYVLAPAAGAVKIPEGVPLEIACVIGCAVQTGVGAVLNTASVEEGASVLVFGLGGIGLSVVQGARLAAAAQVLAVDPVAERREAAKALGATQVFDPDAGDCVAWARDQTGVGVDYAFDCVGSARLVESGYAALRNGGTVVCVGAAPLEESVTLTPAAVLTISQKRILGCTLGGCNSLREIPRLVGLWQAGRLDLEALVTARRPLGEINRALDDLRAGRGVRTVLDL